MMTRDEIIEAVQQKRFSARHKFWSMLDERCWRKMDGNETAVKVAWPWALGIITVEEWNQNYEFLLIGEVPCASCGIMRNDHGFQSHDFVAEAKGNP